MWFLLGFGDLLHINLSFFLAYYFRFASFHLPEKYIFLLLIFNFSWLVVASVFKLYQIERVIYFDQLVYNLFKATIVHLSLITSILFVMKVTTLSREHFIYAYLLNLFFLVIWRGFALLVLKNYRRSGFNYRNVVIVGTGKIADQLYQFFNSNDPHGFRLLSMFYQDKALKYFDNVELNEIQKLEEYCTKNKIHEIFYTMSVGDKDIINNLIKFSDQNLIRLRIIPDFRSFLFRKVKVDFFGSIPIITLREEPLQDELNRIIKRIFDLAFSSLVILFIYPWLIPIVSIAVKLSSKGPVFFKQLRSGINNKDFYCYKFRTMELNPLSDKIQATKNDPRITKIGAFLRKTSLDEFPQFLNVLKGEMSIVGPRPHMLHHTQEYAEIIDSYMVRHLVKPGITGSAQVYGYRGEIKTASDMKKRVELDLWYIENWSILLDLKLIFLTTWNMIRGEDAAY